MSLFITFPYSKPQPTDPKITKIRNQDNNDAQTIIRRKRRRLEVIDAAHDAEKDHQELVELVKYAIDHQCGAQTALKSFQYSDGTHSSRNLSVRQVEYAIKYVYIVSFIFAFLSCV